jgi:hypothetical protein
VSGGGETGQLLVFFQAEQHTNPLTLFIRHYWE